MQVKDNYYYSKEYTVEVKDSRVKTKLKAKIGGLYLKAWYLEGDANLVLTLRVNLPGKISEKIKNDECRLKIFQIKNEKEVAIDAYKDDY